MKPTQIDEAAFKKWANEKHPEVVDRMYERYGTAIGQRIKEINWQFQQLDKAQAKLSHLFQDPIGKMFLTYLVQTNEDFKSIVGERRQGDENEDNKKSA